MHHPVGSRTMFTVVLAAVLTLLAAALTASTARCDTGVLQLKVQDCIGNGWIQGGLVEVSVYRPGVGTVDSDSGYTNSVGYVSFTFTSLADGDEMHVTVTPSGHVADSDHFYTWVYPDSAPEGAWQIEAEDSGCSDSCYDQGCDIIRCIFH